MENTVVAGSVERSHAQKFPSSMAERKSVAILPPLSLMEALLIKEDGYVII
jgi:hypothetical protein